MECAVKSVLKFNWSRIFPFLVWLRWVNKDTLRADLIAGFTGAVVVLPQGVAYATIAGLPPEYGLYTAMVTPVIAALFGSSYHLISGPTAAISIVVFSAVSHHAETGSPEFLTLALTLTFLAGVYQLVFGLARLGVLVNFISHTVVIGFTAGAAILIATSQLPAVLGYGIDKDGSFLHAWVELLRHIDQTNLFVLAVSLLTIVAAFWVKARYKKIPNLLIAMIAGSVLAVLLHPFAPEMAFVGEMPSHLPPFSAPDFSFATIRMLAPEAFAIALLGLIEAVSISRAVATRSNQRIDASQEFVGQGLSNVVGSFFSSYAGSGSFTRSGINYDAGAKTPMSALFAALSLMGIVLLVAPLTAYLPAAAMAAAILLVAYNLIDVHHIGHILRNSKSESAVLLTTFFSTLFLELEFAIYMGVLLSLVLFLARTSTPRIPTLSIDPDAAGGKRKLINILNKPVKQCPQLKILRVNMSVYFGSINHIQNRIGQIVENERIHHILIVGDSINFMDLAGAEGLIAENQRLKAVGGGLYFSSLNACVYEFAARNDFIRKIGSKNFFDTTHGAIAGIYKRLDHEVCKTCPALIFEECW